MTRPRSSLDRVLPKARTDEATIRAMAAKALQQGVILFLRADLARIPWTSREIIEAEARRLYGNREWSGR